MERADARVSRRSSIRIATGVGLSALGTVAMVGCERWSPAKPQPRKSPVIGILSNSPPSGPLYEMLMVSLRRRLAELGYVDGQNLVLEYRGAEAQEGRYAALAAELVTLQPSVIVATSTLTTLAAKAATTTIPIVFFGVSDPVGSGVVASLSRPGGNVSGFSFSSFRVSPKRLQLLAEIVPGLMRVALLRYASGTGPPPNVDELQSAAQQLGLTLQVLDVKAPAEFEGAIAAATIEGAGALFDGANPLSLFHLPLLLDLLVKNRLPAMHSIREYVVAGGLMSYGPNYFDLGPRAMGMAVQVIKGAKPADLPVEEPNKFDLALNLKAAQLLGLTVPESVLIQVTERIDR